MANQGSPPVALGEPWPRRAAGARGKGGAPPLALDAEAARQLSACVHCGFCLPACPTYRELGEEADSPRGRIDMIGAAHRGEVALADPDLALHLDRCLDCRACESACPSGVRYHLLLEAAMAGLPARSAAEPEGAPADGAGGAVAPALLRFGLSHLVRHVRLLGFAAQAARRWPGLARRLPPAVAELAAGLPLRPERPARFRLQRVLPAQGEERGEVDLFLGCVQDACFGGDNVAIARVLQACGYEVHLRARQTCCGALHAHTGARGDLRRLARRNVQALSGDRPVVVGAAGCSAMLREYGRVFAGTRLAASASALAARVIDFSAFVGAMPAAQLPVAMPPGGAPVRVTYHDPCHLSHGQGVRRQPRELLALVPGLQLVEMAEADACCGSAGVYNLTQPELSAAVLRRKVDHIRESGARWVVTANPGCLLQLRAGLRQAGLDVRVVSIAQVLAEAYAGSSGEPANRAPARGRPARLP